MFTRIPFLSGGRGSRAVAVSMAMMVAGVGLGPVAATEDDDASISIQAVGDQTVTDGAVRQPVSGPTEVAGTAASGTAAPAAPAPLVADAGDSPFVASGSKALLSGLVYGGTSPYTYEWTSPVGTIDGAAGSDAFLDTTGVAAGTYEISFTVTDADGVADTDAVLATVYDAEPSVLLDASQDDPTPGVLSIGAPGTVEFPFEVPEGVVAMNVEATWTNELNDYDLRVLDPAGEQRASSGGAPPSTNESAAVDRPEEGTWVVAVDKFLTAADTLTVRVTATIPPPDPRPTVDAGGPYRFQIGEAQHLDGAADGGTEPLTIGWDLDSDGVFETDGAAVTTNLAPGRHLVTLKATDSAGYERRQTTTVLVADADRLAAETTPFAVIGIADTGINPYHLEFSAQTYPDPDVLALTDNFTKHPSEYLAGYPTGAQALPVTLGQGYFPAQDEAIWNGNETIEAGRMYWIPGTKIVGAIDAGGSTGATSSDDPHPILDDNGHGSGSASVSAGNHYGYCPTCLLVVVEGLDETVATSYPWVDITSHSFGYVGGIPIGPVLGPNQATKAATERGQTVLFAAGNGVGNAFDVPISTYGSDQTGPDWNITVGALRRDNQRAVVGDGIPVHISAWGDGNLPSACRTGTVGQCAFGGTSAATPYTAGVFGTVLTRTRDAVGDQTVGQRVVGDQGQVVADGLPQPSSVYLEDGLLTRAELRDAVLRTAHPLEGESSPYPYPLTAPYNESTNVLFEGYGAATPNSAERAVAVLLGDALVPDRSSEDEFFALDRQVRDTIYGGYDRDGDGAEDFEGLSSSGDPLDLLGVSSEDLSTVEGAMTALQTVADASAPASADAESSSSGTEPFTYYLHRQVAADPGTDPGDCTAINNEMYTDRSDTPGDLEPCFDSRITSVVAAFRPLGIWASTDTLDSPLPAGSTVTADLYLTTETPAVVRPTVVLMATDREIGEGVGEFQPIVGSGPLGVACEPLGAACWVHYTVTFETTRPAFIGEQITVQTGLFGTRSWAFGYEGDHASQVTIAPAEIPATGLEFGAEVTTPSDGETVAAGRVTVGGVAAFPDLGEDPTGAGDHPTQRSVEVSLDDPDFTTPTEATFDEDSGTWSVSLADVAAGDHTVYARAAIDRTYSDVDAVSFTAQGLEHVEWQIVQRNSAADPDAWSDAEGVEQWRFSFDTSDHGNGPNHIVARLVSDDAELARDLTRVTFRN